MYRMGMKSDVVCVCGVGYKYGFVDMGVGV